MDGIGSLPVGVTIAIIIQLITIEIHPIVVNIFGATHRGIFFNNGSHKYGASK